MEETNKIWPANLDETFMNANTFVAPPFTRFLLCLILVICTWLSKDVPCLQGRGLQNKGKPSPCYTTPPPPAISCPTETPSRFLDHYDKHYLFSLFFFLFYRYEIQAVRNSLLSGELENSTMPWKTTEKVFRWMDEIRRQIGVVYKEDL